MKLVKLVPPAYTKVYELPDGIVCYAKVVGKLKPLPRRLAKSVLRNYKQRWIQANKKGIHIFRGEVYDVKPQFNWAKGELGFLLFATTFDRLLARWLKVGSSVVRGIRYITDPALPIAIDPETGERFFVLAHINKNRLHGSSVNFIGGTMDNSHTIKTDPLQANLWNECDEEVGIRPEHVKSSRYLYLVETEGAFYLVSELILKYSPAQMMEHFNQFTIKDKEKEVVGLIFIPATKEGVLDFFSKGYHVIPPVAEVLQVAVGLRRPYRRPV